MIYGSNLEERAVQRAMEGMLKLAEGGEGSLHVAKNVLNGGEISPDMWARFDQQRFQTGCHKLLNMVPLPQGGITKRPGFEFLAGSELVDKGEGKGTASRLLPFIFSENESRVLEFMSDVDGGCGLRVWTGEGFARGPYNLPVLDRNIIPQMTYAQSADVMYLAHRLMPPMKLCRYADDDWRLEKIEWLPRIGPPTIVRCQWIGDFEAYNRTDYTYVATAVDAETGEESLACAPVVCRNSPPLSSICRIEVELAPQEGVSEFRVYRRLAGVYGFVGRVPANEPHSVLICEDRNIAADTADTPPNARNPFAGPGDYPAVVFLHQQRLGFAASDNHPMTIWMSQAGNFESMSASVPPADDDAIEATLAAARANRILWCASDRSGLAIGTEGGEWNLTNGDSGAVTPSSISFNPQTFYGSRPGLEVLQAGASLLFAQRGGNAAREFAYSFSNDRYDSADLSVLARHILENGANIRSWCWQPEPLSLVWLALDDGAFATLTFLREHEVIAWARHATSGKVLQFCSIPDHLNSEWQVWAITLRQIDGRQVRCVERLRHFHHNSHGDIPPAEFMDGPHQTTFQARCVPALPDSSLQDGTSFLRVKKINAVKARVVHCAPFHAKVTAQQLKDSQPIPVPARFASFTHEQQDWACPLAAGWRDNPKLELIFDGPSPATVLGLTITLEISSESGAQRP